MKSMLSLFTLLILAIAVPAAQAQPQESSPLSYDADTFWQLAAQQVVLSLESEHVHVRSQTLKNVIVFSTLYRDRIDLGSAVTSIARVGESDENSENRRLALAALKAIGSYRAKHYLAELSGMEEDEYRMLVAAVISEYHSKPNAL